MKLAQTLRRSENEFVGVGSGLMDQFSSLFGAAGAAGLFLDCYHLDHQRLTAGNACLRRSWSAIREPRAGSPTECTTRGAQSAIESLPFSRPDSPTKAISCSPPLLSLEQLEAEWEHLDPIGRKRARHVLTENERVRQGAGALKAGDPVAFGRLMSASQRSSRDDFENSSPALNALIEIAEEAPGFLGQPALWARLGRPVRSTWCRQRTPKPSRKW